MGRGRKGDVLTAFLEEREPSLRAYALAVTGGDLTMADGLLEHALGIVFSRGRGRFPSDQAECEARLIVARTYLRRDRRRRQWAALRQLLRPHDWTADAAASTGDPTLDALGSIGSRERVSLLRYLLDGSTVEEISHEFTLPPDRVRAGLRGAIAALEARLGPLGELDLDSVPVTHRSAT